MTHTPARQPAGISAGGQYATMIKSEATGVTLPGTATEMDVDALAAARDELRGEWLEADGRAEFPTIDFAYQRASAQLAAAAVLRDYPNADTLVLWENLDGEIQYDLAAVRDADGLDILDATEDSDWTRTAVGGENSVQLDELGWALDLRDDDWADGIAEIGSDRHNGKTAIINLRDAASLNTPGAVREEADPAADGPTAREVTASAMARFEDLADIRDRAEEQAKLVKTASQHASMQLLAACILERHPGAHTLELVSSADTGGRFKVFAVRDNSGDSVETGATSLFEQYVPGGGAKIGDLAADLDEHGEWADGVGHIMAGSKGAYASLDLAAIMATPSPVAEAMANPRTRPLTRNEQADLVEAAYFGLPEIEDAAEKVESNERANALLGLHERVNRATRRTAA
ncbi:hypothetical protein [Arthrobacter sp. IK3]|uniref:hypothetical protein n=1 Tax=Arthrobacter sp. IK3 TaxID=3448169 RepID=UPI003EE32965